MIAKLHDRMPLILREHDYDAWLDPKKERTDELQKLLTPYPAEAMWAYTVSVRVNCAKNEGPDLIQAV